MSMPRFGPAGKPPSFKGPTPETPRFLREESLDALEYQATRGVRIKQEEAEELGRVAKECDVALSIHAPYFINLSGEPQTVENSKKRLVDSAIAASWMGAYAVVFHPGYYGKRDKREAFEMCLKALSEVVEEIKARGVKEVYLAPETTGKVSQVGTLDEVLELCESLDMTRPTVDWAHMHARGGGSINTKVDYLKIIEKIEARLGFEAVKELHTHYSLIEYGSTGERKHHNLDEEGYGPPFRPLAEVIAEQGLTPVIICETPALDVDAVKMREIMLEVLQKVGKRA